MENFRKRIEKIVRTTKTMKTIYSFGELKQEVQKIVIEGHIEYLNSIGTHKHSYEAAINDLTVKDYKYCEGGNVVINESTEL